MEAIKVWVSFSECEKIGDFIDMLSCEREYFAYQVDSTDFIVVASMGEDLDSVEESLRDFFSEGEYEVENISK